MALVPGALLMLGLTSPAHAVWQRATSEHFEIYADTTEAELRAYSDRLERFDALLRRLAPSSNGTTPRRVTVVLWPSVRGIRQMIGSAYVAGFYQANVNGAFAFVPSKGAPDMSGDVILFHEYAHHFMMQYYPGGSPTWYSEGYAEFFATADIDPKGKITVGMPPGFRAYGLLEGKYGVKAMVATLPPPTQDWDTFYAHAWLLTRVLIMDPARAPQLRTYLADYNHGQSMAESAKAFGDLSALQRRVNVELSHLRRSATVMTLPSEAPPPPRIDALTEPQGAMILTWSDVASGVRDGKIASVLKQAQAFVKTYPDQPMAWDILAEISMIAKDWSAATAANDQLLKLSPKDVPGLGRRAQIMAGELTAANVHDARWLKVRRLAVIANRADPSRPLPHVLFFESFVRQGIAPSDLASHGLDAAEAAVPQSSRLRLLYGADLVFHNRLVDARVILGPLVNSSHASPLRAAAVAVLATPPTALSVFDQALAAIDKD